MSTRAYRIRPAGEKDTDPVEELWVALHEEQAALDARAGLSDDARERWENDYPVWLDDEDCCLLIAVDEADRPVGFLHAEVWVPPPTERPSEEVYVNSLYVAPEHRNQGVGGELVSAVKDWARERGTDQLRFGVLHANSKARRFWRDQGAAAFVDVMTVDLGSSAVDEEHNES